nr:DUF255 domain-containing protein [Bacillus sp. (in: firmicutes)]
MYFNTPTTSFDWFPWVEEAFERKPVLVSIGYSTYHWWHVC